jgi:hypothetical protein
MLTAGFSGRKPHIKIRLTLDASLYKIAHPKPERQVSWGAIILAALNIISKFGSLPLCREAALRDFCAGVFFTRANLSSNSPLRTAVINVSMIVGILSR